MLGLFPFVYLIFKLINFNMKKHVFMLVFLFFAQLCNCQDLRKLQERITILEDSIALLKRENADLIKQLNNNAVKPDAAKKNVSRQIKFEAIPTDKKSRYAVHYLDKDEKSLSLFVTGDWNFVFETNNSIQNLQLKAYSVGIFGDKVTVNIYVDGKLVKTDSKKLDRTGGPDVLINLSDVK